MDDGWDDAVLSEQVRMLMQQRQAAKRSANALGLGGGDMRSAAPAEAAASSVALAAVARGARGRRLAREEAGTGQATRGASAQLSPAEATRVDEAATAQTKAKAKNATNATEKMANTKANKVTVSYTHLTLPTKRIV